MTFQPILNGPHLIFDASSRIAEHPAAPGNPYCQEGRQATVYQLLADDGSAPVALKVFKPRFRLPGLVSLAESTGGA